MNTLLQNRGFVLEVGENQRLQHHLTRYMGRAYQRFRQSWNTLLRDPYLRDGGNYRFRRYSVFSWKNNKLQILPHEPHYQSSHYNHVHGGFNRHFRAWLPTTQYNPVLAQIIHYVTRQFSPGWQAQWRIQAHQFRIIAKAEELGRPTPEGVHKDGAEYILIMLMDRQNIRGGVSKIYDNDMNFVQQAMLENAGDLLLVNDHKVYHGVTEIEPENSSQSAWRDVLVLTFHKDRKSHLTKNR